MVPTDELNAPEQVAPATWAVGSAALALGQDQHGREALALWQISVDGRPTGAWVEPVELAFGDRNTARRLLTCIERRALTGANPDIVGDVVTKLSATAEVDGSDPWWDKHTFLAPAVFADVVDRRMSYEKTIGRLKDSGRKIADLEWAREFSAEALPATLGELRELARLAIPEGAPAVAEALTVAHVLRWLVELWGETEQVKGRRTYIQEEYGPVEPLPPTWRVAVAVANTNRLPL
ncbi:DUF6218 family protein [Pseudonocardia sp. RS010]|uniref:DUF6218 family protein n=1 Tax=Pseudonocardia sp. RS010 TaxID=3385979 RepID=UPI00399FD999